jgi:hypothetical protein
MAIFQLQAKDAVIRINNTDALNAVQSFSWDSALNAENLSQLGDANFDAQIITPEVTGSFEVRSTGATAAILSRMIYRLNPSTGEFTGPMGTSNTALIRETDLEFAVFDIIEAKKANEVFDRSTLIPRAFLTSLALSASAEGTATETYSFSSDVLEIFRKPYHDLVSVPVLRKTGSETTTVVVPGGTLVEGTTVVASADWKIHALDIDGKRIPASGLTVTGQDVALSGATVASGVTIPLGARTHLLLYRKVPGAFPTIVAPTTARFVKADKINIWLVNPAATFTVGGTTATVEAHLLANRDLNAVNFADSDLVLRVQSCNLNVDLQRESLQEIRANDRGNSVYYRAAQYPLNITADFSAYETDLDTWAKLQSKNAYGSATPDILNLADFENKEWMLVTRYYKGNTTLQTVALLNAKVENPGSSVSVGGRAETTFQMTGSKLAIKGANA